MPVTVSYPQVVEFHDRTRVRTTDHTWRNRYLMAETDMPERAVRAMLRKEGFVTSTMEYNKPGRLGHGMEKKYGDWQLHVRLFRHGRNIQIDGEVEVSGDYLEHLTHGWLPALDICIDMIKRHFGRCWVYHKKRRLYVTWMRKHVLRLDEPGTKTGVAEVVAALALAAAVIGTALIMAKKD